MLAPARKRTRSPGEEALPKTSKKLEITEIHQPVPARNFFAPFRSKNMFSEEDHMARATNANPAAPPSQPERIREAIPLPSS
jgi:hypothetical protein